MKDIELTFGIPVYNAEEYICDLLNCFKENASINYEVIIVDDGSTDNSYNICKKYENEIFKVFHKNNDGVSSTRNYIISHSNGKWLTFIDADDLIDFNAYIYLYKLIKNSNYNYCIGVFNNKKYKGLLKTKNKLSYLIENEIINSPCNKFYKLDILKKNRISFNVEYSLGEDLLFNIDYYNRIPSRNIYFFYNGMYKMRTFNGSSLSRKYRANKFEEKMEINDTCRKYFNEVEILKSFEYIRIKNCFSCVLDIVKFPDKFPSSKIYINSLKKYKRRKYIVLNNFKTTFIYLAWYFMPASIIYFFTKTYDVFRKWW